MSIFSKIALPKVKRSVFDLSHETKFTTNFGQLVPIYWNYFEPGCTFKANAEVFARFAPMLAPIMHRVNVYTAWFKWPIRLGMEKEDFENFFTGGEDGSTDSEDLWPKFQTSGAAMDALGFTINPLDSPLLDMLGCPNPDLGKTMANYGYRKFDVMPFRAYADIWNEYYRDQNLTDPLEYDKFVGVKDISGSDLDFLSMKSKCWEKDYFTSALPWAQRGQDVKIPLSTQIEIGYKDTGSTFVRKGPGGEYPPQGQLSALPNFGGQNSVMVDDESGEQVRIDNTAQLEATANNSNTINDLRTALALQRWFERNARVGARYIEQIFGHFGVKSDDARLQRPEYLGGSRAPIQIGEVLQTSESTDASSQGTPAGRGVAYDNGKFIKTYTKEHCIIMCLAYFVPKPSYYQGMPAKLSIRNRYDFVWPEFAHLGEQEVREGELFYQTDNNSRYEEIDALNDATFGYQSRYAQYKFEPNQTHGQFRSTLDFWHLARQFSEAPTLNRSFVELTNSASNLNRIFAVEDSSSLYGNVSDHIWCQAMINITCKRPLPYYSIPR